MFALGRKKNGVRVGISLHGNGIAGAVVTRAPTGPVLERVVSLPADAATDRGRLLTELVQRLGVRDESANAVLAPGDYNMLQVESPGVPDEELPEAVRWRIKDMIDFHIDDAIVDLFRLPTSSRPGAPTLMYVVAARASLLESCIRQIEDAGVALQAVDITELALRNLQALKSDTDRSLATLYLSDNFGLMAIGQGRHLYLSRQLTVTEDLLQADAEGRHPALEALVLELQRSLDYFESQYAQGSADRLEVICDRPEVSDALTEIAGEFLTVPVRQSSPVEGLTLGSAVDAGQLAGCIPAIGGALRGLV